jgi:hypothetical protein
MRRRSGRVTDPVGATNAIAAVTLLDYRGLRTKRRPFALADLGGSLTGLLIQAVIEPTR